MRITGRHVGIAAGLLAGAGIVAWFLILAPVAVETAVVTKETFVASVNEDGKTQCATDTWSPRRLRGG